METFDRESILLEIAEIEEKITNLRRQKNTAENRLQSLHARLAKHDNEHPVQNITPSKATLLTADNLTAEERVSLFMRLFRGRDDVYPKLWESQQSGRKGYTPVCANEWTDGVCGKPRIKCGDCPNRALLPVTENVVRNHLLGEHTIGVYPMLKDETCWLLAADFDKKDWQDDVQAFTETCRLVNIPLCLGAFPFRQRRTCVVFLQQPGCCCNSEDDGKLFAH
jgi:hypothetical protein